MEKTVSFSERMLRVRKDSWHYRLYRYWQKTGGMNSLNYKENLCHYCRVVVFWAPARWFVYARFWKVFSPWMIAGAAVLIAGLILDEFILLFLGGGWIYAVCRVLLGQVSLRKIRWLDDWWNKHEDAVMWTSLGITAVAIIVGLTFLAVKYFIPFIMGVIFLIVLLGTISLVRWRRNRRYWRGTKFYRDNPRAEFLKPIKETLTLTSYYIAAKKHKICPFIEFT